MAIDTQIGLKAFATLNEDIQGYYKSYLLMMFVSHGISGVLFNLYLLRLGLSSEVIGIVNGTSLVAFAVTALPAGLLGRKIPIGTLLRLGLGLVMAGTAAIVSAESLNDVYLVPTMLVGVGLRGFGGTLYIVCSYPLLMSCKPENKTRVFSFRFALEVIGSFSGNLVAGVMPMIAAHILDAEMGSSITYRVSLALVLPFILLALWFLRKIGTVKNTVYETSTRSRKETSLANPFVLIVVFSLFMFLFTMGRQAVRTFFNVYLDSALSMPTHVIGTVMGVARLIGIPAAALSATLTKRYGPWSVLLYGLFAFMLSILALALFGSPVLALLSFMIFSAAIAITSPARDLYSQSVIEPRHRSLMAGAFNAAYGIGGSSIVFAGGFIISSVGFSWLFILAAAIIGVAVLVLVTGLPKAKVGGDSGAEAE